MERRIERRTKRRTKRRRKRGWEEENVGTHGKEVRRTKRGVGGICTYVFCFCHIDKKRRDMEGRKGSTYGKIMYLFTYVRKGREREERKGRKEKKGV
jgi:hypothetical protein